MSSNFLRNNHHNIYSKQPLFFKDYLCTDCTQKKKEYQYVSELGDDPKNILNLGYIEIFSGKYPIYVTTPTMVCPFGFSKDKNQLTLQFTNIKAAYIDESRSKSSKIIKHFITLRCTTAIYQFSSKLS